MRQNPSLYKPWATRMNRLVHVGLLLGTLTAHQAVGSCLCRPPASPAAASANADFVFAGTVVQAHTFQPTAKRALHGLELKLHDWGLFHRPTRQWLSVPYDLTVSRAWKGAPPNRVTVFSAFGPSDCGAFEVGKTYLVYANLDSTGGYSTHLCMGTRELALASADLQQLGTGSAVARSPRNTADSPHNFFWPAILGTAVAVLIALGWRMWRVA